MTCSSCGRRPGGALMLGRPGCWRGSACPWRDCSSETPGLPRQGTSTVLELWVPQRAVQHLGTAGLGRQSVQPGCWHAAQVELERLHFRPAQAAQRMANVLQTLQRQGRNRCLLCASRLIKGVPLRNTPCRLSMAYTTLQCSASRERAPCNTVERGTCKHMQQQTLLSSAARGCPTSEILLCRTAGHEHGRVHALRGSKGEQCA